MNQYELQLFVIRAAVQDLISEHERVNVEECAAKLRQLIDDYGEEGRLALTLVGAEESANATKRMEDR